MRKEKIRGQAIVELLYVSMMVGILLAGFVVFCRLSLLRQRALCAARFGSLLQSSQWVAEETVQAELRDYLSGFGAEPDLQWSWRLGRFTDTPASRFYRLVVTEITGRYHPSTPAFRFQPLVFSEKVVVQEADIR